MGMYRVDMKAAPTAIRPGRRQSGSAAALPVQMTQRGAVAEAGNSPGVLADIRAWMSRELRCLAGRREYSRGNYLVRIASRETVPAIFEEFKDALGRNAAIACLFVFADRRHRAGACDAATAFRFLAEQMAVLGDFDPEALASGAALTTSIELACPVTGLTTTFDDFECVAFCPQSTDRSDPLYDPLMFAPYPCVNMSSDVYGFSRFAADMAQVLLGHDVRQEPDVARIRNFFESCCERWQRIARKTIENFEAITDTSRCPVHVTADRRHWVAGHRDPAFAERQKLAHLHEMPTIYARRITERWLDHLAGKLAYSATGLARDGIRVS